MHYSKFLTFHGQSREICEWVVSTYKDNEMYKDNTTTQMWVEASEQCLIDLDLKDENVGC